MNDFLRNDMSQRAKLAGEDLQAFERLAELSEAPRFATADCQETDIKLPLLAPKGSRLAEELDTAAKQRALIPFGGGTKTWQGSTDNQGHLARLLTERNAPNPFMYNLMGYNSDGAREFPWKTTAGTDVAEGVTAQKFLISPESGAFQLGLRDRQSSPRYFGTSANINGPQVGWEFFPGTILGEVVSMTVGSEVLPFEIRLRRKVAPGLWAMDVLRPFVTKEAFAKAVEDACKVQNAKCPSLNQEAKTAGIQEFINAQAFGTRRDPLTLSSTAGSALEARALVEALPTLPASVVTAIMKETPFRSVFGQPWARRGDEAGWSPVNLNGGPGIVPKGYLGTFLPLTLGGCRRCHESAGRHVDLFDPKREQMYDPAPDDAPRARTWYNFIPGDDGILSFHPFDAAAVDAGSKVVTADMKSVDRSTLNRCFVDLSRPAIKLTDADADGSNVTAVIPAQGQPATITSGGVGPAVGGASSWSSGPGSSDSTSAPNSAPNSASPPASAPSRPGTNSGGTPPASGGKKQCFCVVRGSRCLVTDATGKTLVDASAADICATSAVCNQELYRDAAAYCSYPLTIRRGASQ